MFKKIAWPIGIGAVVLTIDAIDPSALETWVLAILSLFWASLPVLQYVMTGMLIAVGAASLVRVFRQSKRSDSTER